MQLPNDGHGPKFKLFLWAVLGANILTQWATFTNMNMQHERDMNPARTKKDEKFYVGVVPLAMYDLLSCSHANSVSNRRSI